MLRLYLKIRMWVVVCLLFYFAATLVCGYTDPLDCMQRKTILSFIGSVFQFGFSLSSSVFAVYAVMKLYASLGVPPPGPIIFGVDPCGLPNWQGLECENGNIIGM